MTTAKATTDGRQAAGGCRQAKRLVNAARPASVPLAPPQSAHLSLAPARTRVYLYVLSFGGFKPNPPRPQSALRRPPRPRRRRLSLAATAAAEPHRLTRETLSEVDGRGRTPRINSHRERTPRPSDQRRLHTSAESHHDRALRRTDPHV